MLLMAAMVLAWAPSATATDRDEESPFRVRLSIDIPILASALLVSTASGLFVGELAPPHCDPCDREHVNALDRGVIGNQSPNARVVADLFQWGVPLLAAASIGFSVPRYGASAIVEDIIIIGQAAAFAGATQQLLGVAFRRPRPYMYTPDIRGDSRREAGATLSFFSGHVAVAYAATFSAAYIHHERHPEMSHRWLLWLAAALLPAPLPILRVASGDHFYTDVIAGTIFGATWGLVTPWLHKRRKVGGTRISLVPVGKGVGIVGLF